MKRRPGPGGNGQSGKDDRVIDTNTELIVHHLLRLCLDSETIARSLSSRMRQRRTRRTARMASDAFALSVTAHSLLILLCSDLIHQVNHDEPEGEVLP
jgi:hypothetical protein